MIHQPDATQFFLRWYDADGVLLASICAEYVDNPDFGAPNQEMCIREAGCRWHVRRLERVTASYETVQEIFNV